MAGFNPFILRQLSHYTLSSLVAAVQMMRAKSGSGYELDLHVFIVICGESRARSRDMTGGFPELGPAAEPLKNPLRSRSMYRTTYTSLNSSAGPGNPDIR